MNSSQHKHLHPVEKAGALDNRFRLFLQNPGKILQNHILPGMTVLDLGCGTGYFTLEIAKRVGDTGKVIASDVQDGMLEKLKTKIKNCEFGKRVVIHRAKENSLGLAEKVDFVFAFYSFHEMKYIENIIKDLTNIVKPQTPIYISEQRFHVTKNEFTTIIHKMENNNFSIYARPKIFLSRTVILKQIL